MSEENANGELEALLDCSKEELVAKIASLQARVSYLQGSQAQPQVLESSLGDDTGRMQQQSLALDGEQQQRVAQDEDGATTDGEKEQLVTQDEDGGTRDGDPDDAPVEEQEQEEHGAELVEVEQAEDRAIMTVQDITELPSVLLGHALQYLTFLETRFFFGCGNRVLWEEKRVDYDSEMIPSLVLPTRPPYAFIYNSTLTNVCSLDLGPWCSDVVLALMRDEQVLPNLEHLGMARSIGVTDEGLALLPQNPVRCRKLKSLDIQFCRRLSFGRTFYIRELFKALAVIRRQPPWLDGLVNLANGRMCKYWADGTFAIWNNDGGMLECGYVCDLYENGSEDCVVTKEQVAFRDDEEPQQSWSEWEFHACRFGQTFLQIPDGQFLDASPMKGIYPPNNFPRAEHVNTVQEGYGHYFDEQGDVVDEDHPDIYAWVQKHRLQPLDALMPPPEIVELCRSQLNNMHRVMAGRNQEQDERQVHVIFGGDEADEPPPEWFQYYS